MLIGLPHPLLSISWGNMTFHMSELWHGEINQKKKGGGGGALKISEYFLLYFSIPAEIQCLHDSVNI